MDEAENDVLAFMTFPRAHWTQIYSTNPLERLNAEIKRRTNVVGIFPNDASITRLVGAMMLEQNDEGQGAGQAVEAEFGHAVVGLAEVAVDADTSCRASRPGRF